MSNQTETPTSALSDGDFAGRIIAEYLSLYDEIADGDRAEHDLMPRVVDHLFIGALGWTKKDYSQEDDWNDIRFYDEDRHPAIIVEGKRRDVDVEEGIEQVFRYASETPYAEYLISTNIDEFVLYERTDTNRADTVTHHGTTAREIANINFEGVRNLDHGGSLTDELSAAQTQEIAQLRRLQKEFVTHEERYDDFSVAHPQDVASDEGFQNLLDALSTSLEDHLLPYTLNAFDYFMNRYEEYDHESSDLERQIERLKDSGHDDSEIADLENQLADLREEYDIYAQFHEDYRTWVRLSNRQDNDPDENKDVFCRESVYVQLNKVLLIRIAEDKDLINRMISDGGVEDYFAFWEDFTRYVDRTYIDLFQIASEEMGEVYDRLYSRRIFDWEIQDTTNPELDEVIQRTLWHLNHFEFSSVDRDVLGHLYQEHLPPEERKMLGEFYTPTAIVDLILDSVGYTPNNRIETEGYDLLDPACGSGTFLVRAANRLLDRLDRKGVPPEDALEVVRERLHGFDINPFACHIAEMNLLFQVIDLYRDVKEENPDYTLGRFHIYQTDSLRSEEVQGSLTAHHSSEVQRQYHEERQQAAQMKSRNDYDVVVGNPPYVRIQNIPDGPAKDDYDDYSTAHYNYDIYVLFLERAADWLAEGGTLGFITSNKFIRNRYGEKIRQFIIQNYQPRELINFGDISVFEAIQAYPLVFIADRINKDTRSRSSDEFQPEDYAFTYGQVTEALPEIKQTVVTSEATDSDSGLETEPEIAAEEQLRDLIRRYLPETPGDEPPVPSSTESVSEEVEGAVEEQGTPPIQVYPVRSELLAGKEWKFIPTDEHDVVYQMEEGAKEFQNFSGERVAKNGVQTGSNDIFLVDSATIKEYGIEDEMYKPFVAGEDVQRWHSEAKVDEYLLYTTPETNLDDYPGTKEYLEDNREELEDRYTVKQGKKWYQLARHRPETFDKKKVVTPDICYYSNFWFDESADMYALNTSYCLALGAVGGYYLAGVLNSDAVQFYLRRSAPKYGNNYMRYQRDYIFGLPIPDPAEDDNTAVDKVISLSKELHELAESYQDAKSQVLSPENILDGHNVEPLSFAAYIQTLELDDVDGEVSPSQDGTIVQVNVQSSVELISEETAEAFTTLVRELDVETIGELENLELPTSADGLVAAAKTYEESQSAVESAPDEARELEKELNKQVHSLYSLNPEARDLVDKRVDKPENPLEAKVRE